MISNDIPLRGPSGQCKRSVGGVSYLPDLEGPAWLVDVGNRLGNRLRPTEEQESLLTFSALLFLRVSRDLFVWSYSGILSPRGRRPQKGWFHLIFPGAVLDDLVFRLERLFARTP